MCASYEGVHEDFSGMSQYLTEAIDSSMCVRFTLTWVNGRTERTTEMMQMYSNVLFVQKYACDQIFY